MYILGTGCQWRAIRRIWQRAARCMTTIAGTGTARCGVSTMRSISNAGRKSVTRGQPNGSDHRCTEHQKREKDSAHIDPNGYDAGKKVKGKKRHVLVDTEGMLLHAIVTAADTQDRDGGAWLLGTLFGLYPFLLKLYANGGYQGPEIRASVKAVLSQVDVEIVRRSDQAKGFVVFPNAGCRENTRLADPLPSVEQGFGEPQPQGAGVPADRFHSLHGQKAMPGLARFPDRLSRIFTPSDGRF